MYAAVAVVGLLSSCADDDALPSGGGEQGKSTLKISFSSPSPGAAVPVSPEYAIVTLTRPDNEEVFKDKKVDIAAATSGFVTTALEVEAGNYSLKSFVVYDAEDKVVLATPFTGSPKALGLMAVLPLAVEVTTRQVALVQAEVAEVASPADASVFGYHSGQFGEAAPVEGQFERVSFTAQVTVGTFLYDNLSASVLITATDDKGNSWTAGRELNGETTITLPTSYDNYYVQWAQWGELRQVELDKETLFSGKKVVLQASVAARKLKSEMEYIVLAEGSRPESKTEYAYDGEGKLSRRDFYHYDQEKKEFVLQLVNSFEYRNGRLHTVTRTADNLLLDTQEYVYDETGRILKIVQTGLNGKQEATWIYELPTNVFKGILYSFDNGLHFTYEYKFQDGNIVHEYSGVGNTSGASSSQKVYDSFINPHYLLGITDYFLRSSSKNNVKAATHSYAGNYPVYVPSTYGYTYDGGYPIERLTTYKGYLNPDAGYTAKTVFEYFE